MNALADETTSKYDHALDGWSEAIPIVEPSHVMGTGENAPTHPRRYGAHTPVFRRLLRTNNASPTELLTS